MAHRQITIFITLMFFSSCPADTARALLSAVTSVTKKPISTVADPNVLDISIGFTLLSGHNNTLTSACFSPDESSVAITSYDGKATVWSTKDGSQLASVKHHSGSIYTSNYNPKGDKLLISSYDGAVSVWNTSTLSMLFEIPNHGHPVYIASFSPDGTMIVTAIKNILYVWNASNGALIYRKQHPMATIYDAHFSPDSNSIALALGNGSAEILNTKDGSLKLTLIGHMRPLIKAVFSNTGSMIATTAWDNTLKVWDAQKGTQLFSTYNSSNVVFNPDFSTNDKKTIAINGTQATVYTINKSTANWSTKDAHSMPIHTAKFSKDGKKIFTIDANTINIWNASTGILQKKLTDKHGNFTNVYLSDTGDKMIVLSADSTAKLWTSLLSALG